jgi:hypothetical protein
VSRVTTSRGIIGALAMIQIKCVLLGPMVSAYVMKDILCQLVFAVCIGNTGNRQMKRKFMENYTLKYSINLLFVFTFCSFAVLQLSQKKCMQLLCQHKVDNLLQG